MDNQIVELLGENLLIDELLRAGLEVAYPARDKGIDLIVYKDKGKFLSRPIQLKSASDKSFSIDKKYKKIPKLLVVFVWGVGNYGKQDFYSMTYGDIEKVCKKWWKKKRQVKKRYSTSNPSKDLLNHIKPYRMSSEKWKK